MGVVKRLGWILLGIAIGGCGTMGPRVLPQKHSDIAAPISIKFVGVLEQGTKRVAIFYDSNRQPIYASEGQTVLGQYKLLKIDVASVTISYLDGTGEQQIQMAR